MFGRPRCREWTPLATQQLRLRSLIQIVGYNIRPPEFCNSQCSYYVTLHHTSMSAPFYTSERISSPHPKWKEIDSETTHCMSASNVVIRIWCHMLTNQIDELSDLPQDTVIQTWGVYFSGLRYIGANLALNFTSDCFKSNTLVFQMHGGYFCSYKSLKLDVIPPENEIDHGSLSSSSSNDTSSAKVTLESRFIQSNKVQSRSVSPSNKFARADGYSKSQSPVERGFKQHLPKMRSLNSLSVQARRRDAERDTETNEIYEHSPDSSDVRVFTMTDKNCDTLKRKEEANVDVSETAESYDLRSESCWTPKYRYLALNFLKSEIRPSYNAVKLQKLHLLQYSIKKRQEAVKDIKERIYSKSALSQEDETIQENVRLKLKSRSQRNLFASDDGEVNEKSDISSQNGRVKVEDRPINGARTLKLNDLLSFKSKPSPFQRSEQIRLTKQLEILRFKRIILADERDSKLVNIRRLKETYSKLCEENQDVGTELMQAYHTLSRQTDSLKEACQSALAVRDLAARSHAAMQSRRAELVHSLLTVFPIEQSETPGPNGSPIWQICSISLGVCGDSRQYSIQDATSDCAAAGLVAQAVCLLAALCNLPTRYSIQLMGSATTVVDTTTDLPNPEIPLFARGGDVTLFRYAMFLLNKCIAQLMYARGLHVTDMRPTLANLRRLVTSPPHVSETAKLFGTYRWLDDSEYPRTQSLRSLVASDRGKHGRQFNRFKQTVDGQSPQSLVSLRKHSRSVGSYHDDHELSLASTAPNMGSEPNIYNHKQTLTESTTHNSDSDISKINQNDSKVYFTLGENECLQDISSKLVKMSTNNDDEYLSGDVKRICDQIEDYCSSEPVEKQRNPLKDSMENLDIAKYIQGKESKESNVECPENDGLSENVDCSNVEASEVVDSVIQDEN